MPSSTLKNNENDNNNNTTHRVPSEPTISLCMIVKNEEEFLERCLKSICDFVDEIIIVDTGSTDGTIAIAERFTDKIYHHPWQKSFSIARNQALQYATCDWVFQIDADEELVQGGGVHLRNAVNSSGNADIIFIGILSSYSKGSKMASHNFERLFRNNGIIHYEGDVHNRIVGGSRPVFSSVQLIHHGYDVSKDKFEAKFKRTTDLLKQEIIKDPNNPLYHHYLGVSYLSVSMHKDAVKESELAISMADSRKEANPIYLWTHFNASMSCYQLGDFEKAEKFAMKAYEKSNDHLDSVYMLTVLSVERSRWEDVILYANKFLDLLHVYEDMPEKAGIVVNNTLQESGLIYSFLGHAYYFRNDPTRMIQYYQMALDNSETPAKALLRIGAFHLDRSGDLNLAKIHLDQAIEQEPEDPEIGYVMAKFYKMTACPVEEKMTLEWLYKNGNREPVIFNRLVQLCLEHDDLNLGLEVAKAAENHFPDDYIYLKMQADIYKKRNEPGNAMECYLKILEKEPGLSDTWNQLGNLCREMGDMENAGIFLKRAELLSQAN
jgi:glycosyltransferase involved in cell wall biosynthesis